MGITSKKGNPLLIGATVLGNKTNFALAAGPNSQCAVVLYDKNNDFKEIKIPFEKNYRTGNIWAMEIDGIDHKQYEYNYVIDGEVVTDKYAKALDGKKEWGVAPTNLRGVLVDNDFDWEDDDHLYTPFDETILYRLHVRGFTKHSSSKVRNKGTYKGIIEKIPYLKSLGITMVELMPAYDFNEKVESKPTSMVGNFNLGNPTLNFWGYTDGFAFAPKASFAAAKESGGEVNEFKELVKQMHKNGIEVSMEFYFPGETSPSSVLEVLRYWVMEYHIDGVHLNCDQAVMKTIEKDDILAATKVFTYTINDEYDFYQTPNGNRNFANFNDDFMVCARKFVKGDEDMLNDISYKIKRNPKNSAIVNYVANHNTFTLYDTVSYDRKYNEINGENNKDGAVYNYSWNCGVEGTTRKRTVMELRKKQIKNMLCLVFLSQGVPMIYSGDEFCNSQKGNNNPYCLDNEISWVNWNKTALAKDILAFTKQMIQFRKDNKVLHLSQETRQNDYDSLGLPDLSYHGTKAWAPDFAHFNRHLAVMLCGKYAMKDGAEPGKDLYIAYNMYWQQMEFGMPVSGKKRVWKEIISTDTKGSRLSPNGKIMMVPPRSVVIFEANKPEPKTPSGAKKATVINMETKAKVKTPELEKVASAGPKSKVKEDAVVNYSKAQKDALDKADVKKQNSSTDKADVKKQNTVLDKDAETKKSK